MKLTIKSIFALSALVATAIAPVLLSANRASAQPEGTKANYIGVGAAAGITNGGDNNDAANFGGNIQGRITTNKAPVSLRGSILFSGDNTAIMPIVSYDVPITDNANVYVGAGYSFTEKNGQATPLGNTDAPVVTVGAEAELGRGIMIYGDTKVGINAYENSSGSAVSIQAGAGVKF